MEEQNLFEKIKSKYVLEIINTYIKSFNFIYQLIAHSKSQQKRLKINLLDYQKLYHYKSKDLSKFSDDKNFLNLLKSIFLCEDEAALKRFVIYYYQINKPNIYENSFIMRFELPLCEVILKNDLAQYFDIFIPILEMRENNSLILYQNKFNELNKSNAKYSSLYLQLGNPFDKITINALNIKFNQITKLKIDLFNFRFHYNPLFSFNVIKNNLIYLSLTNIEINYRYGLYPPDSKSDINESVLEIINELISLKYLKLSGIKFKKSFVLKLSHLKTISINKCNNIIFEKNIFSELNTLELKFNSNIVSKSLLNCPEIKECFFEEEYGERDYNSIINFSSLVKLEKFTGYWKDFLLLEDNSLKEIKLRSYFKNNYGEKFFVMPTKEQEQKLLEKICSIKSLKIINFCEIDGYSLPEIKMDNKSVSKITIRTNNNLNHFQKIFPNLSDVAIRISNTCENNSKLAIKEIIKSKISKFSLSFSYSGFPIFNSNSNEIFNNLKIFHLKFHIFSDDEIINIYNNINNMPNLEDFKIIYKQKEMINVTLKDFISKILHLKFIKKIKIYEDSTINRPPEYTAEELKKLFPDINVDHIFEIRITK